MSRTDRSAVTDAILAALPGRQSEIARALGRKPSDGTVRRRLAALVEAGDVEQVDGEFRRCQEPCQPLPEGDGVEQLPGYVFPPGFDDIARVAFVQQVDALLDAGVEIDALDVDLIERYVGALQRGREAQSKLNDEGLLTSSARGRRFVHPAVAIVRESERDAQVYMESLRRRAGADVARGRAGAADGDEFDNLS